MLFLGVSGDAFIMDRDKPETTLELAQGTAEVISPEKRVLVEQNGSKVPSSLYLPATPKAQAIDLLLETLLYKAITKVGDFIAKRYRSMAI